MRRRGGKGGLLVVAALVASACGGEAAPDVATGATDDGLTAALTAIETSVEARLGQEASFAAASEAVLSLGDEARTDATGLAQVTYPDGSLTRLTDNAQFVLAELSVVADSQAVGVGLDAGRAWNRVQAVTGSQGRFEVEASVANAAVRGTAFDVDCVLACLFSVLDGAIELLTSSGATVQLTAGQAVEVGQDGTPGPVIRLASPLDPWFRDNLDRDENAGFAAVADPPQAAASPGIGGSWTVTFTVAESNDPQAPQGAQNTVPWEVTMNCPSGPCDGSVTTTDVPVASFTFSGGVYVIDEQGEQTTVECRDAGVVAWDRASTGQLSATHASADDAAVAARFVGTLTEVLTPRQEALDVGCIDATVIRRVTTLKAVPA